MLQARPTDELLVTAGNFSLDDTLNPDGTACAAPGGDALYSAIGATIWRYPVAVLSRVGSDYPAEFMDRIALLGIGVEMIRSLPGPTVHYRITNAESDERLYEHLTPERRLDELSPQGPDLDAVVAATWLHVAAMPIDLQEAVISRCRAEQVPYSLDPHEEFIVGYEERLSDLIEGSLFTPSQLELGLLFPDLAVCGDPHDLARAGADRLLAMGARAVAIKLGVDGCLVADASDRTVLPALPTVVVDSTGAGDAFCGGFLAGYLKSGSLLLGAVCGTVSAAHIIRGFGAFHADLPTSRDLLGQSTHLFRAIGAPPEIFGVFQGHFPWLVATGEHLAPSREQLQ